VLIRVRYTLYPGGRRPFGDIEYILQTGAGWRESIGEATITAHLPDPVTAESVSLGSKDIFGDPLAPQPAGYVVEGDTITWHFTNLEPTAEDNIFLNVLEPQRYARLLQARRKVQGADPDKAAQVAAAYLELARAAQGAVLIIKNVTHNGGGPALAEEASAAYRRSLELDPEQPAVYSEYAHWLLATGGWRQLEFEGICPEEACALVQRGLEKFPQDAELLELNTMFTDRLVMRQTEIAYASGAATQDAVVTLTQAALETRAALQTQVARATKTPQPSPTPIPATATEPPTVTPVEIISSPQPSPAAVTTTPAGGNGLCSGGAIPLALVSLLAGVVYFHRRDTESTEKNQ
jgi:hypothetical protein